ncbi:MAG TPA: hypothetical protein VHC18_00055 [Amycolatopsis sp.]|nr:hypothetical protein [Amycolatopsis sp.]
MHAPLILQAGQAFTSTAGVTYAVTWTAQPVTSDPYHRSYIPAQPWLKVNVHVTNQGAQVAEAPSVRVAYNGTDAPRSQVAPPSGGYNSPAVLPGQQGDLWEGYEVPPQGARIQVELALYGTNGQMTAYWTN